MTELQAKFQAEAAEFKALQKELQKVFLRLRIVFAISRSISSAFFSVQAHLITVPLHD
jgi:chaperonin cofactor prefoldin